MTRSPGRPAAGFSTLEALVASAVLALGMIGLARLHVDLRAGAEAARERSEAARLAQQDIEQLRAFGSRAGWAAIADAEPADVSPPGGTTRYLRERSMASDGALGLKTIEVTLRWTDRHGAAQSLALRSTIASDDPVLSGALAVPRPGL